MVADTAAYTTPADLARRRINASLRGPVLDVLAGLLPDVASLPRERAVGLILSDYRLLHRCFQTFRARRDAFQAVLVDRRDRPVRGDNEVMSCGRTLNQTISMMVRSAAKRHFRQRLDPWQDRSESVAARFDPWPQPGWRGMLERVMGNMRPPTARTRPPGPSAADRLYDSIKEYLLHDWQVPILPQYARMTPAEVTALGSRILDFRDAGQLAAHLDGGEPMAWPAGMDGAAEPLPQPVMTPAVAEIDQRARLIDLLTADGSRLAMKAMVPILAHPEIAILASPRGREGLRPLCRTLSRTGAATVRQLAVGYGLPADRLAVFLAAAADTLGGDIFERLFGPGADAVLVDRIIARARASGLKPDSPPAAFNAFMRRLFAPFRRGD